MREELRTRNRERASFPWLYTVLAALPAGFFAFTWFGMPAAGTACLVAFFLVAIASLFTILRRDVRAARADQEAADAYRRVRARAKEAVRCSRGGILWPCEREST